MYATAGGPGVLGGALGSPQNREGLEDDFGRTLQNDFAPGPTASSFIVV